LAGAIPSGDAARILTGATLPDGVDSIAMQEDVRVTGGRVFIPDTVAQGANIRRAGEEIGKGQIVLPAGRRLRGADIGLLAALGVQQPPVRKPLRVAVLSAGWELIEAGLSRPAGAIHDANRPALKALLAQLGVVVDDLGIRPDDRGAIRAALAQAAEGNDAIISTAGVSVGDEDHVCAAASELGSLDFRGVAIKPGRPVAFGHIGKAVFFGLPGNPAAMMIAFALLARPGIRRLAGEQAAPIRRYPAIADFALHKPVGRRDVLRCVTDIVDGAIRLRPHRLGGSAILTSIAESDGLVEIAEDIADVAPGDSVLFAPFAEYGL
jgi:molybdopterin molybdotransferase